MSISIAVCERDRSRMERLRTLLTDLTLREDLETQVYWLYGGNQQQKLLEYASCLHLTLISLDQPQALDLGRALYAANPDCYLLYYKQQGCDLTPLLCTRPIAFHAGQTDSPALREQLCDLFQSLWSDGNLFRYESKAALCLLPYGSIQYMESEYKYVLLHVTHGPTTRLYAKLDDMAARMNSPYFMRVHQSYLVNLRHVQGVDKTHRCLTLSDGTTIPISKRYYEATLEALR